MWKPNLPPGAEHWCSGVLCYSARFSVYMQTCLALQRLLTGAARGIECFQVNVAQGLIAYAEKVEPAARVCCTRICWSVTKGSAIQGLTPLLHIHSCFDLRLLQTITWTTQAGFAALAFSGDGKWLAAVEQEQDCRLAVWDWQEVCAHAVTSLASFDLEV